MRLDLRQSKISVRRASTAQQADQGKAAAARAEKSRSAASATPRENNEASDRGLKRVASSTVDRLIDSSAVRDKPPGANRSLDRAAGIGYLGDLGKQLVGAQPGDVTSLVDGLALPGTDGESAAESADPFDAIQDPHTGARGDTSQLPDLLQKPGATSQSKGRHSGANSLLEGLGVADPNADQNDAASNVWGVAGGKALGNNSGKRMLDEAAQSGNPIRPQRGVSQESDSKDTSANDGTKGKKGDSTESGSTWSAIKNFFGSTSGSVVAGAGVKSAAGKVASGTAGTVAGASLTVLTSNLNHDAKKHEFIGAATIVEGARNPGGGRFTMAGSHARHMLAPNTDGDGRSKHPNPDAPQHSGETRNLLGNWKVRRRHQTSGPAFARFVNSVRAYIQSKVNPQPDEHGLDRGERTKMPQPGRARGETSRGSGAPGPGNLPDPAPGVFMNRSAASVQRTRGGNDTGGGSGAPGPGNLPDPAPTMFTQGGARMAQAGDEIHPGIVFDPTKGPPRR